MQDSLEDYIRISRNVKEGPTQLKKEVIVTAQIKKDCDAKALQILQFAIEGKMRSDALFRCLPYINQSHYQDIVEERAISKLCGYPLCSKRIPDMPKKQYYISTKNNKIYDITDRKNYCSNFCYRASIHIKSQIDTSPLWLRKHNEKAHFTLLGKSEKGLPGEVVDQGITKPSVIESHFTSVSAFTQMSLDEAEELELSSQEEEQPKKQLKKPKKYQKNTMKTINENEEEEQMETEIASPENTSLKSSEFCNKEEIKTESLPKEESKIKEEIQMECSTKKVESAFKQKRRNKQRVDAKVKEKPITNDNTDLESHIHKCFKEWLTLETYVFIYGEEKVKEKLDSQTLSEYFDSLRIAEAQVEQQKRYVDICRKLHLKDLADEKFDNAVVGNKKLNPIPDYKELKDENCELDLKVKSFYSGELYTKENSNFPTKKKEESESVNEEEGPPAILPLVEVNSQNALRRKIFLNSLNKTVQSLFQSLKLSPSLVLSDLQSLVKTFKLKADNIVFKPAVWNYIAIILLKILSLKDEDLRHSLGEPRSREQLNLWLSSLPHQDKIVSDILNILSNVTCFVEDYLNCK